MSITEPRADAGPRDEPPARPVGEPALEPCVVASLLTPRPPLESAVTPAAIPTEDVLRPLQPGLLVARAATLDGAAVLAAVYAAFLVRLHLSTDPSMHRWVLTMVVMTLAWLGSLTSVGAYEVRAFGVGAEDYKRVASATLRTFLVLAVVGWVFKADLSRHLAATAFPLGGVLLVGGRYVHRSWLGRARTRGHQVHRVLVVGDSASAALLCARLHPTAYVGYAVVGACLSDGGSVEGVAALGDLDDVVEAARQARADTVAVAASAGISSQRLRRLAWQLEGSGISLTIASSLVDIAGPRLAVRPVAGLPLIHVDEPRFTGGTRLLKEFLDVAGASLITLVLLPVMLLIALAVKLGDGGPVFYRQTRIGVEGDQFRVWKFRTMRVDADAKLAEMMHEHAGGDQVFFKLKADPRITPVGAFLRRLSLDELPQLFNVLAGDMSLVGPRPQREHEVALYDDAMKRRLLVKPGMTGLWQVSGRNDLSVEESVRLDLYYVENWSIALDFAILLRTIGAVVKSSGAY